MKCKRCRKSIPNNLWKSICDECKKKIMEKRKDDCPQCGNKKYKESKRCNNCYRSKK